MDTLGIIRLSHPVMAGAPRDTTRNEACADCDIYLGIDTGEAQVAIANSDDILRT